jgi:hypothetical protein
MVIDTIDAHLQPVIEAKGIACIVVNTVMKTLQDRIDLARQTLLFAEQLSVTNPSMDQQQQPAITGNEVLS